MMIKGHIEARPWKPQDLLDDLQKMIDEEPDTYDMIAHNLFPIQDLKTFD